MNDEDEDKKKIEEVSETTEVKETVEVVDAGSDAVEETTEEPAEVQPEGDKPVEGDAVEAESEVVDAETVEEVADAEVVDVESESVEETTDDAEDDEEEKELRAVKAAIKKFKSNFGDRAFSYLERGLSHSAAMTEYVNDLAKENAELKKQLSNTDSAGTVPVVVMGKVKSNEPIKVPDI